MSESIEQLSARFEIMIKIVRALNSKQKLNDEKMDKLEEKVEVLETHVKGDYELIEILQS